MLKPQKYLTRWVKVPYICSIQRNKKKTDMKDLQKLFRLTSKVSIYVPSTVEVDQAIDSAPFVDSALALLAGLFGGATAAKASGAWVAESGNLVKEDVTLVYAFATAEALEGAITQVITHCTDLKKTLCQEAIALEVNGELYFI